MRAQGGWSSYSHSLRVPTDSAVGPACTAIVASSQMPSFAERVSGPTVGPWVYTALLSWVTFLGANLWVDAAHEWLDD